MSGVKSLTRHIPQQRVVEIHALGQLNNGEMVPPMPKVVLNIVQVFGQTFGRCATLRAFELASLGLDLQQVNFKQVFPMETPGLGIRASDKEYITSSTREWFRSDIRYIPKR